MKRGRQTKIDRESQGKDGKGKQKNEEKNKKKTAKEE